MINKIDIQKAASSKHNPAFGVSGYFAARTAFAAGVEWFKKALWHDASEMPEEGEQILSLGHGKGHVIGGSTKHKEIRFSRCLITHCRLHVTNSVRW